MNQVLLSKRHVDIIRQAHLHQDHARHHHRLPKVHLIGDIDPDPDLIHLAENHPLIDVNAIVLVLEIQKDQESDHVTLVPEKDIRAPGKEDIPQMIDPEAEGHPVIREDNRLVALYGLYFSVPINKEHGMIRCSMIDVAVPLS